jgi:cytochrome P450
MPYITPNRQKKFKEAVAWTRDQLFSVGATVASEKAEMNIISGLRAVQREGSEKLTDEEIIQEVMTIGGAGHETTANTVSDPPGLPIRL